MSKLYQCDKCKKNSKEADVLKVSFSYERTPEEISELLKTVPGVSFSEMKKRSVVVGVFDVCRKCYDEFKKLYEEFKK